MYIYEDTQKPALQSEIRVMKCPAYPGWAKMKAIMDFVYWVEWNEDVIAKIICEDGVVFIVRD